MSLVVAIGPSTFAEEDRTPWELLEKAGVTVRDNPVKRRLTESEIIRHLNGVDGLIAGLEPLNRNVMAATAPRLKAIARVGIGVANVDFEAAAEFGVKVSSTPEGPIDAVAELTLAAALCISRKLIETNAALHEGKWKKSIGVGLSGTKVLLIGYGRIGRRTGDLFRAFGAQLLVVDPQLDQSQLPEGVRLVQLEEGLAEAELISLHASGEGCVLGRPQLAHVRPGTILLNSARGGLVDQAALIDALNSKRIAAAWFDAFWEEPYNGPLLQYPQVLLTPHVSTYTTQCRRDMETAAVRNLLRDLGIPQ